MAFGRLVISGHCCFANGKLFVKQQQNTSTGTRVICIVLVLIESNPFVKSQFFGISWPKVSTPGNRRSYYGDFMSQKKDKRCGHFERPRQLNQAMKSKTTKTKKYLNLILNWKPSASNLLENQIFYFWIPNLHSRVKPKLGHLKIRVITMWCFFTLCALSIFKIFSADGIQIRLKNIHS